MQHSQRQTRADRFRDKTISWAFCVSAFGTTTTPLVTVVALLAHAGPAYAQTNRHHSNYVLIQKQETGTPDVVGDGLSWSRVSTTECGFEWVPAIYTKRPSWGGGVLKLAGNVVATDELKNIIHDDNTTTSCMDPPRVMPTTVTIS